MFEWFKHKSIELSEKNIRECLEELVVIANRAYENIQRTGKENPSDIKAVKRVQSNLIIQFCGPIPIDEIKTRFIDPILGRDNLTEGAKMAIIHSYEYAKKGLQKNV